MRAHEIGLKFAFSLMLVGIAGCTQGNVHLRRTMIKQKIQNDTVAIADASRYFGMDLAPMHPSATEIVVANDNTPFLASQFDGKLAWKIVFGPMRLKLKSAAKGMVGKYPLMFTMLIDAGSGQLMNVRAKFDGPLGSISHEASAVSAETQLRSQGELYLGLPGERPKISFLDAVDAVKFGSPYQAKEIDGLYVMESDMGKPPLAVWVINLLGIPPFLATGPEPPPGFKGKGFEVPAWQRDHIQSVIDAATGKCMFAGNAPQGPPPPGAGAK